MEGTMFTCLAAILAGCLDDSTGSGANGSDDSATGATDDSATPPAALPTHWEVLPSMQTPRNGLGCAAVGEDVYAIAGFGFASDPFRKDLEVLSDGTWTTKSNMSTARDYFVTAPRSDGSFVVIGGFSKGMVDALLRYDPTSDGWDSVGSVSNRVSLAGGTISGDRAVITGGSYNWDDPVADTEIVDLTTGDSTPATPAPDPFVYAASATIGDKLYVVGGSTNVFKLGTMDALRVYDATTDAWTTLAPLPGGAIDGHAMVALHDHLFVIGGYAGSATTLSTVWRYDVATDVWEEADPLPNPVADACAVAVGDRIVLVGGIRESGTPLAEAVAYVP
jgi:N-acetylneuraminic acid mutarotase